MVGRASPDPALPPIRGLTADSRDVRPGFLFAALPGARADGRAFIAQAIGQGATAVLAPAGTVLPDQAAGVTLLTDANPRRRFAQLAAAFHGRQPEVVAAVTGTSGKTSVASFTRQIWQSLGLAAASLGTLGVVAPGFSRYGALTTPDPVALHATLAELTDAGITHLAMEASSHGLDQFRLDGVRVAVAGFTNLSRDHLDYHGTMDAYLAAKTRLFTEILAPGGTAVINADAAEAIAIAKAADAAGRRFMTYGRQGRNIRIIDLKPLPIGLQLSLQVQNQPFALVLPLAGPFQAHNAACALGLAIAAGAEPDRAVAALGRLTGVRGRLERVARHPSGAPIYVDYAHKPAALSAVLGALRQHSRGRLVVVFGAGGDRDRGKRPLMGAAAAELADRVIVTDDNPRSEDPAAIRREIMAGCPGATEIGDRAEAIRTAIADLAADDVLVIAGKGHETGQIVGDVVKPFDDAAQARAAVALLEGAQ